MSSLPNQQLPLLDSKSLFDDMESWRHQPRMAFEGLVESDVFRTTNRSTMVLELKHRMRENSLKVYRSMFDKFYRHLGARGKTLLTAGEPDIAAFFALVLERSSSETRSRYARLTERVFEHLRVLKFVPDNPVSAWVRANGGTDSKDDKTLVSDNLVVNVSDVASLQNWLFDHGRDALRLGAWKRARDMTLASLSLGTGFRCAELLRLQFSQVTHSPGRSPSERFDFEIPGWASAATARAHRTPAGRDCAELMELWWHARWGGFGTVEGLEENGRIYPAPAGERIFPSTLGGNPLTTSPLYQNLREVAEECVMAGVLNDSNRWVLERGAQGLRRAFVLTSLARGVDPALLTERLGHFNRRSIRRYGRNAPRGVTPDLLPEL